MNAERSREQCPVCGEHRLELLYFPSVDVMGVQPHSELLGMGEPRTDEPPGIGCAACGAEWQSIEDFRAAQRRGPSL